MNKASVKRIACGVAGLSALVALVCSAAWRAAHDLPIMLYMVRLMTDSHQVPYRDFFDMNLPGTYWTFAGFVRAWGCSDGAVRGMDVTLLAVILLATFRYFSRWGQMAASLAIGLFALRYLSGTWVFTLQREFLALVPFSAALAVGAGRAGPSTWRGGVLGLLFAWMFLIKPQLVLLGVPLSVLFCRRGDGWVLRARLLAAVAGGFLLPVAATALWLAGKGAWHPFVGILTEYWPLYGQMTGDHEVVTRGQQLGLNLRNAGLLLLSPYSACALSGLGYGYKTRSLSLPDALLWLALIVVAALLPCASGQYWSYHKLPFFYVTMCACAFLFSEEDQPSGQRQGWSWAAALIGCSLVAAWVAIALPRACREATSAGGAVAVVKHGVPDAFARYLRAHLKEGDRVQPFDWTGGAVHAMLMTGALPATRFLYTFHFYHHVDTPYIKGLRKEFLGALTVARPRFLLEALDAPMPKGPGTSPEFKELSLWRDAHYHVAESGEGYRIWELNGV